MRAAGPFRLRLCVWLCFLLATACVHAQERFRLERVDAPSKHRRFKVDYYRIHTPDTVVFRKVIGYDRTTLFLEYEVKDRDTLVTYRQHGGMPDRVVSLPRYKTVSGELPVDQVLFLSMGSNGRYTVKEPFAWIGWCGTLAVLTTAPFVLASNDSESRETWGTGAAASAGFIATAFLLDELISKPEERKQWRIVPAR